MTDDEPTVRARALEILREQRRVEAAIEAGLPQGLATRLRGDTLEELAADAEVLAAVVPAPEPTHDELVARLLADNRAKHDELLRSMHPSTGTENSDT